MSFNLSFTEASNPPQYSPDKFKLRKKDSCESDKSISVSSLTQINFFGTYLLALTLRFIQFIK